MLQLERHNQIIAILALEGQVKVTELSEKFDVTKDCIRKDLTILENEGKLKKIHGGAIRVRTNLHRNYVESRKTMNLEAKQIIALKAVELIEQGTMVFLGVSAINYEIAKLIFQHDLNVTIVTNMIDIISVFQETCSARLIFLGGELNLGRDGFLGAMTMDLIQRYKFDIAFLGVVGIDLFDGHLTTYDINDGLTKKAVINSSKKSYVVAESTKLALDGNYKFAHLGDFSGYICEKDIDDIQHAELKEYGLEII